MFADTLTFKGGTSLSKVYGAIDRFSEDIDLSIERDSLGFGGDKDPEKSETGKERLRRLKELSKACQIKIENVLLPNLMNSIGRELSKNKSLTWELGFDPDDKDRQTLKFTYPAAVLKGVVDYISQSVKIELGARSDHYPVEAGFLQPYVTEILDLREEDNNVFVRVLSGERTFWEKATILHAEYHRRKDQSVPKRMSRHYYDLHRLAKHSIGLSAIAKPDLLRRVVEHKSVFFKSGWANYGSASYGSFHLAPPTSRVRELKKDYSDMQPMFFGDNPDFEVVLERLKSLEDEINTTHSS